jgi:hypothetical protein
LAINFDLVVNSTTPEFPGVRRFFWGDVSISLNGIDTSEFGQVSINNAALGVYPTSIDSGNPSPVYFNQGGNGIEVGFNLIDPIVPPITQAYYRLKWGPDIFVPTTISIGSEFGYAHIENDDLSFEAGGIDSPWFSVAPIISYKTDNAYIPDKPGQPVSFNMIQSVDAEGEIDFIFDGFISVGIGSISDGEFGNPVIKNFLTYLAPGSIEDGAFGSHTFVNMRNQVFPNGFEVTEWGTPTLIKKRQIINPTPINDGIVSNITLTRIVRTIEAVGISDGVIPQIRSIQNAIGGKDNFLMMLF